MDMLLNVWHNS